MPIHFTALPGVSLVYRISGDLVRAARGYLASDNDVKRAERREHMRATVANGLSWNASSGGYGEAIIRDVKRINEYPDAKDGKGISSWFRVGLCGTYHRGLQVGLQHYGLVFDEPRGGWRYGTYDKEEFTLTAPLIGWIPFDNIVEINWDGDEYYSVPHFYCMFSLKHEPYEALFFAEERQVHGGRPFYQKVAEYKDVVRLSKKLKTGYYAKKS